MKEELTNKDGNMALEAFLKSRDKALLRLQQQKYLEDQLREYNQKILWEFLEIEEVGR